MWMDFQCTLALVDELAAIHYPICSCEEIKWPWNWVLNVAEVTPLWAVVGAAFPSHLYIWTFMDVTHNHLCGDFERAGQMLFPLGELCWCMALFWYCPFATAGGWRQIIRKFSTCSAIIGLLAAIPANISVFTNFISSFISSHSCRILLFLPFCWFCALVFSSGLWAVFLCWIAGKLKKLVRSCESEPTNKIPSFIVILHFLLSYL